MKRMISLMLAICMMLCMALPAMALEVDASGTPALVLDSGIPEDAPVLGESGNVLENEAPPLIPGNAVEPPPDISPLSDFGDGDTTFTTKIRLTVTDRDGNPLANAVYGLYSADGTLIQELITDSYGIAVSEDVPVNTDYYVEEITAPSGFQPNAGRHEIVLTDVCAPSRVDVNAKYDPITGRIEITKTDEAGNLLSGVGFTVYRYSDWTQVDDITTDENGKATTTDLPYGEYVFSEYNTPDGLAADSYYHASIYEQDVVVELPITNYLAKGDVKITKTGNDGRKVQGAVFSIFHADTDVLVQEITTGSGGTIWSSYMPLGNYYAVETSVPAPYKLDATHHEFSLTYHNQSVYLTIENVVAGDPGKVKIIKTDESDNPLSGVVFGLYRTWDAKKLGELTTGADGTAESGNLIPGDYYLLEQTGKPGYTLVEGQIAFTIDGSGVAVEKTVINPKIRIFGKVKVIKQDDAGTPIAGVKFGVYCDEGNLLEELTTGADGTAISGVLNEGGYYLTELVGVDGYLTDDTQHPFTITENESVIPVTVTNPRITGSVKIFKTDGKDNPLSGVEFGVFEADSDKELDRFTTDMDGVATSKPLYYGDYYLKELSTQDGYELIDTPIPFSISEQDVVLEIPVTNPMIFGSVTITKYGGEEPMPESALLKMNAEDETLLSGAVFGLYNAGGQKLAELVTGEDGRAVYDGLPQGSYYLKELRAPEGYVLLDELLPFEIQNQGDVEEVYAYNPDGKGIIRILKSGEDNAALSGVAFTVHRIATDEKVGDLLTDAQGIASLELPLGRYYLLETATAPGYSLLSGKASFTLTENGKTVELPIMNQKESCKPEPEVKTGIVKIIKTDATDSNKKLSGASFSVYETVGGKKVGELLTGKDGTAVLELPEGDYTIRETTAPEGYQLFTESISLHLKVGETRELTVKNTKSEPVKPAEPGTLRIIKQDKDGGKKLGDAVFGVYRSDDDKKIGELTTDRKGIAEMELPEGDYYIRELEAPDGYKLKKAAVNFHVDAGETKELTVKNVKEDETDESGTLRIIKEDKETGDPLKNAIFTIYDSDDSEIDELTTGKDGMAELDLPVGSYYLRESEAPKGYQIDRKKVNFKVTADKTVKVTVENIKEQEAEKTGILQIVKSAAGTGKRLEGAVFAVYAASGDKRLAELTTDKNGIATLDLAPGDYYLKEQKAPEGFKVETARILFTIKADEKTVAEITNEKDTGEPTPTPAPEQPVTPTTPTNPTAPTVPEITILKTGEAFPTLQYALAALCFGVAALCGTALYRQRKKPVNE